MKAIAVWLLSVPFAIGIILVLPAKFVVDTLLNVLVTTTDYLNKKALLMSVRLPRKTWVEDVLEKAAKK